MRHVIFRSKIVQCAFHGQIDQKILNWFQPAAVVDELLIVADSGFLSFLVGTVVAELLEVLSASG